MYIFLKAFTSLNSSTSKSSAGSEVIIWNVVHVGLSSSALETTLTFKGFCNFKLLMIVLRLLDIQRLLGVWTHSFFEMALTKVIHFLNFKYRMDT